MTERTTVLIELDVEHTDGLPADEVAGYALEGARLALDGVGLPTPYEPPPPGVLQCDVPRLTAHTRAIRLAGAPAANVAVVEF